MTNNEVTDIFNAVYFGWWKKYRSAATSADLQAAMDEGIRLTQKYHGEPLVYRMVEELYNVLEGRIGTEKDKKSWRDRRKRMVCLVSTDILREEKEESK